MVTHMNAIMLRHQGEIAGAGLLIAEDGAVMDF
jgi:hypothetical protein